MAKTFVMMQGDSYPVPIDVEQAGVDLTPDMIADLEVCVGTKLRYLASTGGVGHDGSLSMWYIRPSQADTLSLEPGSYDVVIRVKYLNKPQADVKGVRAGKLVITQSNSKEVI